MEGSGRGLIEVLSQQTGGGTENKTMKDFSQDDFKAEI
jgi:hypothetical protein